MQSATRTDFLKLHFIVLLWGFTAVLGTLIRLPPLEVVFIRSGFASLLLALFLRSECSVHPRDAIVFAMNGALIGLHWVLFFASAKVANVSVCMVGMATVSLWTALLEPLMVRGRRLKWIEFAFGVIIIAAVLQIVRGDTFQANASLGRGLLLAVLAALTATIFSIINAWFVHRADAKVIVTYEMAGACAFCGIAMLFQLATNTTGSSEYAWPTLMDSGWMAILVIACTVYAYTQYVELLNRMTVFTINFANNMEPTYGIVLGALIFRDHEQVDAGFYVGAFVIALTVAVQPLIDRD